ncbi:50S ribosome-binding GTPase [Yangia mangrovi]|uniref:50S ribosome-binding GTPase n=1 Tax=Alloyangia mangrovi TaxID=1779329 RepID=A0ABT2KNK0_9RHOB|nr:50S ribosome-binding GTPase [Alloyangia mangrovi]
MLNRIFRRSRRFPAEESDEIVLPVVWLLGKTGAGKSSLVCALTEQSYAEIGDGFQPCTRSARSYDFPPGQPLVRFLDTRGLGEAGYDPTEDLAACRDRSHVLLVVCRLDDPVQGMVADALTDIVRAEAGMRAILVLTGKDLVTDPDARERARAHHRRSHEPRRGAGASRGQPHAGAERGERCRGARRAARAPARGVAGGGPSAGEDPCQRCRTDRVREAQALRALLCWGGAYQRSRAGGRHGRCARHAAQDAARVGAALRGDMGPQGRRGLPQHNGAQHRRALCHEFRPARAGQADPGLRPDGGGRHRRGDQLCHHLCARQGRRLFPLPQRAGQGAERGGTAQGLPARLQEVLG